MDQPINIMILAGEASGDTLGANLIEQLSRSTPSCQFSGMGGEKMQQAGAQLFIHMGDMAIIGFVEVLKHLPNIYRHYRRIKRAIVEQQPDLVICIDNPGFNLRMARMAKKQGCKVLFYVSPQIWAWRYGRIKTIKRYIDHMAVLFPFEKALYDRENVSASYVGHPLVDRIDAQQATAQALDSKALEPIIAILPGSRHSEIERMFAVIMQCCERVHQRYPNARFVLPLAPTIAYEKIQPQLKPYITVVRGQTAAQACQQATCALCVSGTITLEMALLQIPHIIIYKSSWISYCIARCLVKLSHFGLSNIVAGKTIAKEFLQNEVKADTLADELLQLIAQPSKRQTQINALSQIKQQFGHLNHSQAIATVVNDLLKKA